MTFLLVGSTCNIYQAEVRGRTFPEEAVISDIPTRSELQRHNPDGLRWLPLGQRRLCLRVLFVRVVLSFQTSRFLVYS